MSANFSSSKEEEEEDDMSANISSSKEAEEEHARIMNNEDIRIVLVGKTGAGKSATGNTILGYEAFRSEFVSESLTIQCQKESGEVDGRNVSVVDTPGLFDTRFREDKVIQEIKQCICFAAPGPHMFLLAVKLGRFTEEEQKAVKIIQDIFGPKSINYTMILFTHGDQLKGKSVEEFCKNGPKKLQKLISNGHYHVLNNEVKDCSQVTELLEKINNIVLKNGERSHYTNEMFQEAEKLIEEKKQKILKKKATQKRKEEEELRKKYAAPEDVERLEQELKMLTERYEHEARKQAEKDNKFMKYSMVSGAATGAALAACYGGYIGGITFGPPGAVLGGLLGALVGSIAGGAAGAGTASNLQAVEAGARAVKVIKDNCNTQ